LDVHFPLVIYKKLLGLKPTFEVSICDAWAALPQDTLQAAT
jgi:hypothetical protein